MKRTKPYKSEGIRPLLLWPLCDPLRVFELLVWTWVLPLCSSFPPLLGAVWWSLPGFHNKNLNANQRKTNVWCRSWGLFFCCVRGNRTTLWYGFEISIQTIPQTSASPKNPSFSFDSWIREIFLKIKSSPSAPLWLDWYRFAIYLKLTGHLHE